MQDFRGAPRPHRGHPTHAARVRIQRREGRGLASLMRPTKPYPGVPFAVFRRYAIVRTSSIAINAAGFAEVVS